jgi:hypothetical protein
MKASRSARATASLIAQLPSRLVGEVRTTLLELRLEFVLPGHATTRRGTRFRSNEVVAEAGRRALGAGPPSPFVGAGRFSRPRRSVPRHGLPPVPVRTGLAEASSAAWKMRL